MLIIQIIFHFITLYIAAVTAIRCYSCESAYEEHCGKNFEADQYFQLDCDHIPPPRYLELEAAFQNATACMKRVYKEEGLPKIQRHCFFGDVNHTSAGCLMDPSLLFIEDIGCYVCDNDNYCNNANSPYKRQTHSIINYLLLILLIFIISINKIIL